MVIQSVNPATGQLLATFETLDSPEIEDRLALACAAFALWKRTSFSERAHLISRAADILEAEAEQLGLLMTAEMGKPLRAAADEVLKSARGCRYYAQYAAGALRLRAMGANWEFRE